MSRHALSSEGLRKPLTHCAPCRAPAHPAPEPPPTSETPDQDWDLCPSLRERERVCVYMCVYVCVCACVRACVRV